jgi:hypothetical protein
MALTLTEFNEKFLSFHAPEYTRSGSARDSDVELNDGLTEDFDDDDEDNTGRREVKFLTRNKFSVSGTDSPRTVDTLTPALSEEAGLQGLNQA